VVADALALDWKGGEDGGMVMCVGIRRLGELVWVVAVRVS
jgi:hypothetical protein